MCIIHWKDARTVPNRYSDLTAETAACYLQFLQGFKAVCFLLIATLVETHWNNEELKVSYADSWSDFALKTIIYTDQSKEIS